MAHLQAAPSITMTEFSRQLASSLSSLMQRKRNIIENVLLLEFV